VKDTSVAVRYAQALFEAAADKNEIGPLRSSLGKLNQWLRTQDEVWRFLLNPVLPLAAKEKVVDEILPPKSPKILANLLKLLIHKKRLEILNLVAMHFDQLADSAQGILRVGIRTPQALTEDQRRHVLAGISHAFGHQVTGEFTEDAELLGGLLIRWNDKVIDLSISGQLSRLEESLVKTL